jgi:NADPH:quinone reductase-like Zn-dependent oxidoreductase
MKQYILAHRDGIEGLELQTDVSIPPLRGAKDVCASNEKSTGEADDQIRINIKCLSLNARDLQIATNDYPAPHDVPKGVIPVSGRSNEHTRLTLDGSGVVEAVGEEVTLFKVGDRVAPVFPQGHDYVSI